MYICEMADCQTNELYEIIVHAQDAVTAGEAVFQMGLARHEDDSLLEVREQQ